MIFLDNMQNHFIYELTQSAIFCQHATLAILWATVFPLAVIWTLNDARNAPFMWTRIEPKAENLVQLIESKVSVVVPFNCDCELRLCRARFSQESLGMFNEVHGIPPRSYWRHLFNGENIINQWRKYRRCNRCSCPGAQTLSTPSQQLTTWEHHEYVLVHPN